ncbi:MAG: Mobile element protein, partial [uncultured Chloroflexia bacterium]
ALVEEIAVTPANINDGKAGPDALPDHPGDVFADSAYRGNHFADAVRAKGGTPRIVATSMWGRNKNCSQRHDKVERSMNVMRRGVAEPEV